MNEPGFPKKNRPNPRTAKGRQYLVDIGSTKPKLPARQKARRLRILAETAVWEVISKELTWAAEQPAALLKGHGMLDDDTSPEAIEEFKEVLLDVAEWFKKGKRLPG